MEVRIREIFELRVEEGGGRAGAPGAGAGAVSNWEVL